MFKNRITSHLVLLPVALVVGFIVGILYLFVVGKLLSLGDNTGFGLAAAIIAFPMYSVPLTILWIIVVEIFFRVRKSQFAFPMTVIAALIVGLVFSLLTAGPAGFSTKGGAILFNYFLILISILLGSLHGLFLPKKS